MKNTIMNDVNIISYAYIWPLTNDLWVFLFHTIDAEYVKWASPGRTYVYVKVSLSTKLIIVGFWPLKDQTLEEST